MRLRSKVMESEVEALEQKNQNLGGEVGQLQEQMAQMFHILTQTNAAVTALFGSRPKSIRGFRGPTPDFGKSPSLRNSKTSFPVGTKMAVFREMPSHHRGRRQDSLTRAALSWYVDLERGRIKTWRDLVEAFLK
ncbi:hypothetical protein CR513_35677, partial [Mucuna pruriens]